MEIQKHICFREDEVPSLVEYLIRNQIVFDSNEILSGLDIYESNPHWSFVDEQIQRHNLFCQSETIFSKEELRNARWLSMRSQWRFGYPQPEDNFKYETITYTRTNYCSECSSGLLQINPFRIKKEPKWGQRHFAELNWVGDELFLSNTAEELLTQERITGISFLDVYDKKGVNVFPGIRQLAVDNVLPLGLEADSKSVREVEVCPVCGIPKYLLSGIGMLSFQGKIFDDKPDIVKTGEIFGSGHYAARIILVRQKVYQTLMHYKLDRGLVFEPVELR